MALEMAQFIEDFECNLLEQHRARRPFPAMEKKWRRLWAEGQKDEQFNSAK